MHNMARKLGDVAIVVIILTFIVGAFSSILLQGDSVTGTSSGIVASSLTGMSGNLSSDTKQFETELISKTDDTATYEADPNQQIENRNSESSGIANLFTKNILVKFVTLAYKDLGFVPGLIITLILSLIGVTITILLIRFFWGDNRI